MLLNIAVWYLTELQRQHYNSLFTDQTDLHFLAACFPSSSRFIIYVLSVDKIKTDHFGLLGRKKKKKKNKFIRQAIVNSAGAPDDRSVSDVDRIFCLTALNFI